MIRAILVFLFLLSVSGCGKRKDRLADALKHPPTKIERREFGQDYVKNMLYTKSDLGFRTLADIEERLRASGLLDGGSEDPKFHGSPFLIKDGDEIIDKKAFVFASEEVALVIYETKESLLVEVSKW